MLWSYKHIRLITSEQGSVLARSGVNFRGLDDINMSFHSLLIKMTVLFLG